MPARTRQSRATSCPDPTPADLSPNPPEPARAALQPAPEPTRQKRQPRMNRRNPNGLDALLLAVLRQAEEDANADPAARQWLAYSRRQADTAPGQRVTRRRIPARRRSG